MVDTLPQSMACWKANPRESVSVPWSFLLAADCSPCPEIPIVWVQPQGWANPASLVRVGLSQRPRPSPVSKVLKSSIPCLRKMPFYSMFPRLSGTPLPLDKGLAAFPFLGGRTSICWRRPWATVPFLRTGYSSSLGLQLQGGPAATSPVPAFCSMQTGKACEWSGCKFLVTWRLLGPFSCSQQAFHSSLKVWLDPPCPSLWRSCPFFCCCVKSGLATCLPFDIPAGGRSLSSAFWCFQETLHFCRLGCSFSPLGWEWCWPTLYISVESGSLPHERTIWKSAEVLVNRLLLLLCLVPAVLRHPFFLSLGFGCNVSDLQTRASPMWTII